jgi:hypothetical protein
LLDLSKFEFVEDVSYVIFGYASKSHDEYTRPRRMNIW